MGAPLFWLNCSLPGDENCRNAQSGDAGGALISVTGSVSISSSSAEQFPQITSSPALTFLSTSTSDAQTGHLPMVLTLVSGLRRSHSSRKIKGNTSGFYGSDLVPKILLPAWITHWLSTVAG
jgi:hypothetical protein